MCNLSEYIWEKAMTEGTEKGAEEERQNGLSALVNSLKEFVQGEDLYQAVVKNEMYRDISREDVYKYLK